MLDADEINQFFEDNNIDMIFYDTNPGTDQGMYYLTGRGTIEYNKKYHFKNDFDGAFGKSNPKLVEFLEDDDIKSIAAWRFPKKGKNGGKILEFIENLMDGEHNPIDASPKKSPKSEKTTPTREDKNVSTKKIMVDKNNSIIDLSGYEFADENGNDYQMIMFFVAIPTVGRKITLFFKEQEDESYEESELEITTVGDNNKTFVATDADGGEFPFMILGDEWRCSSMIDFTQRVEFIPVKTNKKNNQSPRKK